MKINKGYCLFISSVRAANGNNDRKQMRVHPRRFDAGIVLVEATASIILYHHHHHPSPCPRTRADHTLRCRHPRSFLLDKWHANKVASVDNIASCCCYYIFNEVGMNRIVSLLPGSRYLLSIRDQTSESARSLCRGEEGKARRGTAERRFSFIADTRARVRKEKEGEEQLARQGVGAHRVESAFC